MDAATSEIGVPPGDSASQGGPAFDDALRRRALSLCWTAEPHAGGVPCVMHLADARRALSDEWLRQESEV